MRYSYKVYFKLKGDTNHRYNMVFDIETMNNQKAKEIGQERWENQKATRTKLQNAEVVKITCRKVETQPRQAKLTPLQKALAELNNYIVEDLSK